MPTLTWTLRSTRLDPDADLVRAMAAGDEEALVALYDRHAASLLTYLARRVGDRRLAEELLHDTMLAGWMAAGAYRGESSVRTWLFAIAHNKALNALRAENPNKLLELDEASGATNAGPSVEAAAEGLDLAAAIDRLPPQQQAALELVFLCGFTAAEIGAVMAVRPSTVRSWLSRARAALRDSLSPLGGDHV